MATFTITFSEAPPVAPYYEDYSVTVESICDGDAINRIIRFNDNVTGDLVVGYNYSSSIGSPATTFKIISYEDTMNYKEIATGIESPAPGFTPSELKDNTTGNFLTYPYITPVSNINNIVMLTHSVEIKCPTDPAYTSVRVRKLVFQVADAAGTYGPIKAASFINNPQS